MIRSIFINFSARLAMQIMYFCTLLITTRWLGSDVRGEISLIQLGITMVHIVSDIIGGTALVYMAPRARLSTLLFAGWIWAIVTAAGIGYLMIRTGIIPEKYTAEVLIAALLLSLNSINMNILLGQERISAYNVLLYLQGALMLGTMFTSVVLFDGQGAEPYLHACYVAYGGCFIAGLYFVLSKPHVPKLSESRPILLVLFTTGLFTQLATLTHQWSIRMNYKALEVQPGEGLKSVGLYSTAISLGEAILLFAASVAAVLMARISNETNNELSRKRTLRLSKLSIGVTMPAVVFFALLPSSFYTWLLGPEFSGVKSSFVTIAPGIILLSFGTVFGHYFSGLGKQYMNFFSGLFALMLTICCITFLIGTFGLIGAGLTASIAYGGLSIFIFLLFMFTGRNNKGEWKELLPSRNDFTSLRQIFKKEETDKAPSE